MKTIMLISAFVSFFALGGCSATDDWQPAEKTLDEKGHYWVRSNPTSAIWMEGPKAQQTLNRDIARCVVELKELERLNAIRSVIPPEKALEEGFDPARELEDWDTPARDGALLNEPIPYTDFESCMYTKGWERTRYIPYDIQKQSKALYYNTIEQQRARSQSGERIKDKEQ